MASEASEHARERVLTYLLDKVDRDTYPSATMLDRIESLLHPDEVMAYAEVLLSKVEGELYPSTNLLERLVRLA